jgi:hypothetical protein
MKHLNDNLLCVVSAFITGPDYQHDDILQVCIAPLNGQFRIDPAIPPFYATLQPRRWGADKEWLGHRFTMIAPLMAQGVDPYFVTDSLDKWFVKYRKRDIKKIMPLAYDWAILRGFLLDWLGNENFNQTFDYRYRDLLPATLFANDKAYRHGEEYPIPKHHMSYICSQLGVEWGLQWDCMRQAVAIAECYKRLQSTWIGA